MLRKTAAGPATPAVLVAVVAGVGSAVVAALAVTGTLAGMASVGTATAR